MASALTQFHFSVEVTSRLIIIIITNCNTAFFFTDRVEHVGVYCYHTSSNCGGTAIDTPSWPDCCFIFNGRSYKDVHGGACSVW